MVISTDIDGVLNNYPVCWVEYVNKITNKEFKNKHEMKTILGEERYNKLKHEARSSYYKYNLEPRDGIIRLFRKINKMSSRLIATTSRPMDNNNYPQMRTKTMMWLQKINFPSTCLVKKDKINKSIDVDYHVDDELGDARRIKNRSTVVILYPGNYDTSMKNHKGIKFATQKNDIIKYIENG